MEELSVLEIMLLNEMKTKCMKENNTKAKEKYKLLEHLQDYIGAYYDVLEEKEELKGEIEELKDQIERMEEEIKDNYKRVDNYEFYGVDREDFY